MKTGMIAGGGGWGMNKEEVLGQSLEELQGLKAKERKVCL